MTGSTFAIIMIVIAAVVGLVVFEGLVLVAAERPYFKHPHPDRMQSKVRGGIHLGDPRSMGAPEDEPVRESVQAPAVTASASPEPGADARETGQPSEGGPEPAAPGARRAR